MAEYKTLSGLDLDIGGFTESVTRSKQTLEEVSRKNRGIGAKPETEEIELDSNFLKGIAQLFRDNGYEPKQPSEDSTTTPKDEVLNEYSELMKSEIIQDAMRESVTLGESPNKLEDIYTRIDTYTATFDDQPTVDSESETLEITQTQPQGLMSRPSDDTQVDRTELPSMAEEAAPTEEVSVDSEILSPTFLNAIGITGSLTEEGVQIEVKKILKEQGMSDEEIANLVNKSLAAIDADEVQLTDGKDSTEQGLVTKPKVRQDLFSTDEKTRIKGVQKIIGTKADGDFGKASKDKLKAWQYLHNLPTTGELDETTMDALKNPDTYDPRKITRNRFVLSKTFELLKGVEGFEEKAYIGLIKEDKYKSGLTVGGGLDFGQHSEEDLIKMGLPKSMIDKVKKAGWIGLNPDTIIDPETGSVAANRTIGEKLLKAKKEKQEAEGTFPSFTYEELAASAPAVYKEYENAARKQYNEAVKASPLDEASFTYESFDELSEATKAVLTLEKYHRGVDYDISSMIVGARKDNAQAAANKIKDEVRRKNMKDWLKKVGF
jgi:hypothetical protein